MSFRPGDVLLQGQRLLRYYSAYVLSLGLLLIILDSLDTSNKVVAAFNPNAFLFANIAYVALGVIMLVFSSSGKSTHPQFAVSFFFIDITLLVIMMYASGGIDSGLSNLILIPILVSNLLIRRSLGYVIPAWTTIAVMYGQYLMQWQFDGQYAFSTGLYGFFCFTLAALTQILSRKLDSTLDLTYAQAKNIRRLRKINRHVLLSLPNAVVACDKDDQILYTNTLAGQWLGLSENQTLPQEIRTLTNDTVRDSVPFTHHGKKLVVKRAVLAGTEPGDYLLVFEDAVRIASEAQQIKLASLGRLTASIAHEIRNPLSALRHAAQLLAEATELSEPDRKLTGIIEQHCLRINRTVEDILQISRRKSPQSEVIRLKPWLTHFADAFRQAHPGSYNMTIRCRSSVLVSYDPDQLQQVLHNLCSNGLRYAQKQHGDQAEISLVVTTPDKETIALDISDNGPGVSEENQHNLFEPFFTTEHSGTGLGLYLCREICEANNATINYISEQSGAIFRISQKAVSADF